MFVSPLAEVCRKCQVCSFMPQQEKVLSWEEGDGYKPVLVICDRYGTACELSFEAMPILVEEILGLRGEEFTYTETIRCDRQGMWADGEREEAVNHCSVWTHNLADNRILVVSTVTGLKQLGIEKECRVGEIYKSKRLGYVLCIPPLETISGRDALGYASKIQRVLKEVRVHV